MKIAQTDGWGRAAKHAGLIFPNVKNLSVHNCGISHVIELTLEFFNVVPGSLQPPFDSWLRY